MATDDEQRAWIENERLVRASTMPAARRPSGDDPEGKAGPSIQPLDVMLAAMRQAYAAGKVDEAAGIAKDAAPYTHGRAIPTDPERTATGGVSYNVTVRYI